MVLNIVIQAHLGLDVNRLASFEDLQIGLFCLLDFALAQLFFESKIGGIAIIILHLVGHSLGRKVLLQGHSHVRFHVISYLETRRNRVF